MIPYVVGGKNYFFTAQPYNAIKIAGPGRHQQDTSPVGGDFVVMIDDEGLDWVSHKFTHSDIFDDLQLKREQSLPVLGSLMDSYYEVVVTGADPEKFLSSRPEEYAGIHPHTFLYGVQLLAIAEHRRYHMHEARFGGRFLPLRYSAGIAEGLWTANEASAKQRYGRGGVEELERTKGMPRLTKALMT